MLVHNFTCEYVLAFTAVVAAIERERIFFIAKKYALCSTSSYNNDDIGSFDLKKKIEFYFST